MSEVSGQIGDLVKRIIDEAIAAYDKAIDEAAADAQKVLDATYSELVQRYENKRREVDLRARALLVSEASRAQLANKEALLSARQEVRDALASELYKQMSEFTKSEGYSEFFKRSLARAANALGKRELKLVVRKEDVELAKKISKSMNLDVEVEVSEIKGGLVAADKGGLISIDFSLEGLLDQFVSANQDYVDQLLFGDAK